MTQLQENQSPMDKRALALESPESTIMSEIVNQSGDCEMFQVIPNLFISEFPKTIPADITHVLNLSANDHSADTIGIRIYFHNAMVDCEDIVPYLPSIITFTETALSTRDSRVLVHSDLGINRSAAACILFLCRKTGVSSRTGLAMLRAKKPDVDPSIDYLEKIDEYFGIEKGAYEKEISIGFRNKVKARIEKGLGIKKPGELWM
jgi:protein-tyrosine phosphatase